MEWNIITWERRILKWLKHGRSKSVKIFGINILDEYHHLYVQSDTLLLAEVLESYRNMCFEICELNPACFLTAPGVASQAVKEC